MYKSIATLFALAAVAVRAAPAPANASQPLSADELAKRDSSSGQATYFEVGLGACGWWNSDQDMIVAMNSAQYNNGSPCGKWVTIQNNQNGQTVAAYVADECPSCDWGSLDMSPAVFGQLNNGNYDEGVFPITWWYNN